MNRRFKALVVAGIASVGVIATVVPAQAGSSVGIVGYVDVPDQFYYAAGDGCVYVPVEVGIHAETWDMAYGDAVPGAWWDTSIEVTGISYPEAWGNFDYGYQDIPEGSDWQTFDELMCLWTDSIGQFEVEATTTVYDAEFNLVGEETLTTTFWIGVKTSLSINASPEPVKKGSTITVAGTLRANNPDLTSGLPDRTIHVWRALPGSSHWYEVATDKTGAKGKYEVKVKATKTYKWKATFEPSKSQARVVQPKTSATDTVKVKS